MYDVAIIGGGPAAIFAAYEFVLKYPQLKVIMLEAGNTIEKRFCPLAAKKVDHCINCNPCSIMRGFGGAGAFSDGKYNFTTEFGGWLNEYLPEDKVIELIDYVDELNCRHGAPGEYFSTKNSKIGVQAAEIRLASAERQGTPSGYGKQPRELWKTSISFWRIRLKSVAIPRLKKFAVRRTEPSYWS